ncbi:AraC family transcriptional regulator [Gaoshiqia sediminis]|uniref:AraC family transcriptional regulator n=1 Tax=Gaoshiqia sediminis TaxID=2986998 RepID=A0AA42CAM5_9BACT|nr:AraC family transcriptional regulator [Gaoshiqia sediminis]MCW0483977.1 AraC family transcriptional regulator [Gaoshiqia sediminis]
MKIMHEQVNFKGANSFNIKWDEFPHFTFPWHFHAGYELVYVIKSYGKRFVADHVEAFSDGDLVLLGPNLPHFWKNDEAFFNHDPRYKVNAIVIHFPPDFFEHQLKNYTEFLPINELLKRALRGVCFHEQVSNSIGKELRKLLRLKGVEKILQLLRILDKLARTKNYKLLASETYCPDLHDWSSNRLEKVMHLINSSYRQPLKLEQVASHIGMNPTAFCRYFKEKTGKPFIGFVNDMRIGYACKLLLEGRQNVSQICFESGFNNLSNFNRCFKKKTGFAPVHYRSQFHKANQGQPLSPDTGNR